MKWGVTILIILGLVAAVFAAILMKTLSANSPGRSSEIEVAMAAKALPAMTVMNSSFVTKDTVTDIKKLPKGYVSNPVQAIGRVLAMPVVEGQILTESCFVTEGTGPQLAASLPNGMRAVCVTVSNSAITGGLLYPGCVVDVLASFRLSTNEGGQAISTTLLHGIQVLAVQSDTVVSKKKDEQDSTMGVTNRPSNGPLMVTLMVDPAQAEGLQLAAEHGRISLAMRNPLDTTEADTKSTVLNQGRLAQSGSTMKSSVLHQNLPERFLGEGFEEGDGSAEGGSYEAAPADGVSWPMTVIRGVQVEKQELAMPEKKVASVVSSGG